MSPQAEGAGGRSVAPSPVPAEPPSTAPGMMLGVTATRPGRVAGRRARRLLVPLAVLSPFAVAAWFVLRFDPTDRAVDPTGPCLWHAATGINGPSCGGTRMFYYLIHGNLIEAARHHLPALLAVPFLAYAWLRWTLGRFGVTLPALRPSKMVLIGYGVFFLVFSTVLRNLDWGPLAWFDIENLDPRTR